MFPLTTPSFPGRLRKNSMREQDRVGLNGGAAMVAPTLIVTGPVRDRAVSARPDPD
jgi:hypothetical protein